MKKEILLGFAGWYGVAAILLAYALASSLILPADSLWYQFLNLSGALGLIIETGSRKDYQPFWLNVVWASIAFIALARILFYSF